MEFQRSLKPLPTPRIQLNKHGVGDMSMCGFSFGLRFRIAPVFFKTLEPGIKCFLRWIK